MMPHDSFIHRRKQQRFALTIGPKKLECCTEIYEKDEEKGFEILSQGKDENEVAPVL